MTIEYKDSKRIVGLSKSTTVANTKPISSQTTNVIDLAVKPDGTEIYVATEDTGKIITYELATAGDVSTAVYNSSKDYTHSLTNPKGMDWNNDGTKIYLASFNSEAVHTYTVDDAYDLSSDVTSVATDDLSGIDGAQALQWSHDGAYLFQADNSGVIHRYEVSTAFVVDDGTRTSFNPSETTAVTGISFGDNGKEMYIVSHANTGLFKYTLETAYDLSTATHDSTLTTTDADNQGIATSNGKIYVLGQTTDIVTDYNNDIRPTNVQDNSILVEKDTANRYWFTAEGVAPTTTSHFEGHGQQPSALSDTIDIPTTGLSNLATGSVSFWIYLETESTSAGDYVVISASNDTQASNEFALGFVGHVTGVGIIARNNGSGVCTFTCSSSLTRNAWNHVVYTNNSSGNKVYVNGSQVTPSYSVGSASTSAFFGTVGTNNTCTIGANKDNDSGGYYQWGFDGNLQQLLVYSAVLTQAEITALYNNGKYSEPSTTNLLRRYELTSNANDTSGNGHNGTATAGVTYTSLAVPATPATWTMQSTYQTDFSTQDSFTDDAPNVNVDTANGWWYLDDSGNADVAGGGRTITEVDDEKWLVTFKATFFRESVNDSNNVFVGFGLSNGIVLSSSGSKNFIGFLCNVDRDYAGSPCTITGQAGSSTFAVNGTGNGGEIANETHITDGSTVTWWGMIKRISSTQATFELFSDEAMTSPFGLSPITVTIPSNCTGLNYLYGFGGRISSGNQGTLKIDNIKIYNGVTSIN